MKALILKLLRFFYMHFPLPSQLKSRVKDFISIRVPLVKRVSLAARRQAENREGTTVTIAMQITEQVVHEAQVVAPVFRPIARSPSLVSSNCRSISYVNTPAIGFGEENANIRLMAFYLPQFHPIPENDKWWGKGFTEWSNVTRARPQLEGQWQPHLPGELGFYDLRMPAVMHRQAELARAHGVEGFCFYFYWFGGKRLLERPVEDFFADKEIKLSFSLCWANENWTRRWDGHDSDVLMGQKHSEEDDLAFIECVAEYMRDARYVRIGGRPILTVYRPSLLPNPAATAKRWRKRCRELGIGEIYLAFTLAFDSFEPSKIGFDGAIEFPPNNSFPLNITDKVLAINPGFSGHAYDWRTLSERSRSYSKPSYDLFRGVCPSWDNEARKPGRGTVLLHSSPRRYETWLENAARDTVSRFDDHDSRLVFVNAWNEWAEGAHLEPDMRFGYAYLRATRNALKKAMRARSIASTPRRIAVVIHVFYPELLDEMLELIRSWTVPHRVIVTTVFEKKEEVRKKLDLLFPAAECFSFENKGRDVLPFLKVTSELLDQGEALVLKLHTKRSLHRGDGDIWRKDLLEKLASADQASLVFETFQVEPDLRLVAPDGHVLSMDTYWGSNADTVNYLCRRMGIDSPSIDSAAFPAGSMFYITPMTLGPLLEIHLDESDFEPEAGQVDGTMAHAVERVVGVLATHENGIMATSNNPGVAFRHHSNEYAFAEAAHSHGNTQ